MTTAADRVSRSEPALPRELLHPRHWPSWLGVGVLSLLQLLPAAVRDGIAAAVGELQYRLGGRRRRTVELNLDLCFPDLPPAARAARARAHFHAWARSMADQPALWWDSQRRFPARRCRLHGLEHVHAERAAGRPVILLCPHTSAVELGGAGLALEASLTLVINPMSNPVLDWLVLRVRVRYSGAVRDRRDGLKSILRATRETGALFYLPDEDLGARNSVFVPFFGRPKATLATLGGLARALDAAVVPTFTWYDTSDRRYHVRLERPLEDFPSGDPEMDARTMNATLERLIRQCPAQYVWGYRLFRTRPDGTRQPYPKRGGIRRQLRRRKRL